MEREAEGRRGRPYLRLLDGGGVLLCRGLEGDRGEGASQVLEPLGHHFLRHKVHLRRSGKDGTVK